jgi:hypothetical protein
MSSPTILAPASLLLLLLLLLPLLQSPNSPLEVSVTADLWPLLKFATAANTFLPVAAATGTGGLVMLPAVLPAVPAEPAPVAVDYRFDDAKQQLVPYAIRLQRFTGNLPQGALLSCSGQVCDPAHSGVQK